MNHRHEAAITGSGTLYVGNIVTTNSENVQALGLELGGVVAGHRQIRVIGCTQHAVKQRSPGMENRTSKMSLPLVFSTKQW